MPIATIIAGANASGRSTLISSLYQSGFFDTEEFIGPDLIIWQELIHSYNYNDLVRSCHDILWSKENYLKAFAIADERRNKFISEGKDFVIETVLSTDSKMEFLAHLKEKGYFIRVIYVGVEEDETNAAYLIRRIRDQGHDVPMNRLLKRKQSSLQKLYEISRSMDQTILIDNSIPDTAPCVFAVYEPGYRLLTLNGGRTIPGWSIYADGMFRSEMSEFTDVMVAEVKPLIDELSRDIQRFFIPTVKMRSYELTNTFIGEKLHKDENRTMLIYSTNAGIFNPYGNRAGELRLGDHAWWYGPYDRDDTFSTSLIADWELKKRILTVNTLNSTYIFEILKGNLDTSKIKLAPPEIVAEFNNRNAVKYAAYWCQVDAPAFLSGAMSVTYMPYPMNKQEAIDYVSSGLAISTDGYPAGIVLAPFVPAGESLEEKLFAAKKEDEQ